MVKKMKNPRRLAALAIFAIIAMSAFGFAASNNVSGTGNAGDGTSGAISGYNVTAVSYDVNNTDPTYVDAITFQLNNAANASNVFAVVDGTVSTSCTHNGGNQFTCSFPATTATVLGVVNLRVVAAT